MIAELAQWPEPVAESSAGKNHNSTIKLGNSRCEQFTKQHEVVFIGGLADAGGHPRLVALQKRQQVEGGVVHRQVRIIDGRDPGVIPVVGLCGPRLGKFPVASKVVRHLCHTPRQLFGRVLATAVIMAGHDVFDRGEPMGVDDHDRVCLDQRELLRVEIMKPGEQRGVISVVQFSADLLGKHQRRHM